MPTNDRDAQALTYLACRIRKETYGACDWDEAGTHAVIAKLVGQNLPSVVERVTRHAGDVEAKTPGAINRPFVPAAQVGGPRFPVKAGEDCRLHVGEDAHACRLCPVEGYAHPEDPPDSTDIEAGRALREAIARRREIHETEPTKESST